MIIPESFLWTWFALAALSTAYVAWDNFGARNPEETVMKWGWVLITVYMGPIAAGPLRPHRQGAPPRRARARSSGRCGSRASAPPCTASPATPPASSPPP